MGRRFAYVVFAGIVTGVFSAGNASAGVLDPFEAGLLQELRPVAALSTCSWAGDLPDTTAAPYGAVGFLSNGCTATLVDGRHILTAAHCIINEGAASDYWTNIWFYPNFNGNEASPPRFALQGAVIGAHGNTGLEYFTSDWAIARLETPVAGFPAVPINATAYDSTPVAVGHYSRDDAYVEPNCAAPPYPDELGCTPGWPNYFVNVWWQNGFLSSGTLVLDVAAGYNNLTAPGLGGASGSPHLIEPVTGIWRVNGVTHGAACSGVGGPWAGRFVNAPRFAANVAVASATSSASRSGVFVVDSDARRLVFRERTSPGGLAPFGFYRYGKTLPPGAFGRIAAFKLGGTSLPGVVVLSDSGALRETDWSGAWSAWKTVSAPRSGVVADVDAAADQAGVNVLYAVSTSRGRGHLWRRRRASGAAGAPWAASWDHVISGDPHAYLRVTAVRHHGDGRNQAWALSTAGVIRTVREGAGGGWTAISTVPAPASRADGMVVDIDAGWNSQQRAILVALMSSGAAWYREASSTNSSATWSRWKPLPNLVDPGVLVNRGVVRLSSVTASRWAETRNGAVVPVIFATDSWGNVYQTTFTQASGTWSNWVPFYGKRVDAAQTIDD